MHPTESWRGDMDADQLAQWVLESLSFTVGCWKRRDAEGWLSFHAPDFRVTSDRYLAGGEGDRHTAMRDQFSYRRVFTDQRAEVLRVELPGRVVVRTVMFNDDGDELGLVYAMRFSGGLNAEVFVTDDTVEGLARANEQLDAFAGE